MGRRWGDVPTAGPRHSERGLLAGLGRGRPSRWDTTRVKTAKPRATAPRISRGTYEGSVSAVKSAPLVFRGGRSCGQDAAEVTKRCKSLVNIPSRSSGCQEMGRASPADRPD